MVLGGSNISEDFLFMIDWNTEFASAHKFSWPTASISIQNAKPPNGRNIFQEDKDRILPAAAKHGYKIVSPDKAKVVSFLRIP